VDRYIGLDAHSSSCTVAVVGPSGRRLQSQVLETNAKVLIDFLKTIADAGYTRPPVGALTRLRQLASDSSVSG
jgi:hypothetical protein